MFLFLLKSIFSDRVTVGVPLCYSVKHLEATVRVI